MKLQTESSFALPLRIWRNEAFEKQNSKTVLLFGIIFGFYLIMALYHIPLYFSSGEKAYLYYSIFVAVYLLFQASMSGVAALYLWPGRIWWIGRSLTILGSLSVLFTITFTREFLHTKKHTPGIDRVYMGLMLFAGAGTLASFFIPYYISIQITNYFMSVIGILYISTSIIIFRKGFTPARYYLIAWIFFICAVIIVGLKNAGIIPSSPFTGYVLYLGGALEITLLSFALGDKIRVLTQEREQAEQEKILIKENMLKAAQDQLYTDSLTGLASRNRLLSDLRDFKSPVLFIINIDQFKGINNFYGNIIGDRLIKLLGERLENIETPGRSFLYRLHADDEAI